MQLIKIGGAVFKNLNGFSKLVEIIESYSKKPLIIVISAFSNATRKLKESAQIAELGKLNQAKSLINELIDEHKNLAEKLISEKDVFDSLIYLFENSKERIFDLLKGISITNELTPKTLDNIMSYGEFFALHTIYHYLLEKNFKIHSIDSTSLIISDDNFGNAKPIIDLTARAITTKLKPLLKKDNIILTQGFVAKNKLGEITTMGIESSNLTAVLLSEVLNIKEITYWTDVEGIRTADPKLINNSLPIKNLSYRLAYNLSVNGLKLIYPEMIQHTEKNNISLIFKSAFNPNGDFTVINKNNNKLKEHILILNTNLIYHKIDFHNNKEKNLFLDLFQKLTTKINLLSYKILENSANFISYDEKIISKGFINNFQNYQKTLSSQINIFCDNTFSTLSQINDILKSFKKSLIDLYITNDSIKIILSEGKEQIIIETLHKKLIKKN